MYKAQGVIQPNKEYVFSLNETNAKNIAIDMILYDKDGKSTRTVTKFPFTTAENEELITIHIKRSVSGYSVGGTFKPQFEEGSTATEYEPYHKYKIPIKVSGKNLIPYPYPYKAGTAYGITWTDNGDGTITANGTTTATAYYYFGDLMGIVDKNKKYVLSGSSGYVTVYISLYQGSTWKKDFFSRDGKSVLIDFPSYTDIEYDSVLLSAQVYHGGNGTTVNNVTIKPQLELGSTATSYEPYRGETKHIYLDAPLRKVGDYADYVDFENQKVVRNVIYAKFDQTSYWTTLSGYENLIATNISNSFIGDGYPCLSNISNFEHGKYSDSTYTGLTSWTGARATIMWREDGITVDAFKERLATTPMFIICIRATPSEENISLPTLKTFKDTSIISVDTSIQPSNIKTKYIRL